MPGNSANKTRVALVMGGSSPQREVSLSSGTDILASIDRERFEVVVYDPAEGLVRLAEDARKLDVAFLALNGPGGEDGSMQGFCEVMGLPYTGSGVLSSAMTMDKEVAKRTFRDAGLPVTPDYVLTREILGDRLMESARMGLHSLGSPLVVKPLSLGSSIGMAITADVDELAEALTRAFDYGDSVLLETYLPGRELTCGVVGESDLTALPLVEVVLKDGRRFYDQTAKSQTGAVELVCPADIPQEIYTEAQRLAISAHKVLGCRGFSRSDLIYSNGQTYLLETNTLPAMSRETAFPLMAQTFGLSFTSLISYMIDLALKPGVTQVRDYLDSN